MDYPSGNGKNSGENREIRYRKNSPPEQEKVRKGAENAGTDYFIVQKASISSRDEKVRRNGISGFFSRNSAV